MSTPVYKSGVIVIGAGGHAKVVISVLRCIGATIIGAVDAESDIVGGEILGVCIQGNDDWAFNHAADTTVLANGIGSIRLPTLRAAVFDRFTAQGYSFITAVHPAAIVAEGVQMGEGSQIMAGAVLQPDAVIGRNVIVNTGASIDHDSILGDHVHIAPGVTLSGNVTVGAGSHVGTGAKVVQGITIGDRCLIRAGAVVIEDVADGATVAGVPAKAA